jgi:hypothetical protein
MSVRRGVDWTLRQRTHAVDADFDLAGQPGGFFFGSAARDAVLTVNPSIRRSWVRPGLPANRAAQPHFGHYGRWFWPNC